MPAPVSLTVAEYDALPDDPRHVLELSRGRVVREPRPGQLHGRVQVRIAARLEPFVTTHNLGYVVVESGFVLERNPDTLRGPDVAFVARSQYRDELPVSRPSFAPALAIEILSPSDHVGSMLEKVAQYLAAGSRAVWLIDPMERIATMHRPDAPIALLHEAEELAADDVLPGFRCRLSELFD